MIKGLKETVLKELKERMRMMYDQIENINKEIEIIFKKEPNRNSGLENKK